VPVYDGSPAAEVEERRKLDFLMKELGVGEPDLVADSHEGLAGEPGAPRATGFGLRLLPRSSSAAA
jgi:hypothetical protein